MTETVFIYGLIDPRSNLLRYVGKSNHPERRTAEHIRDAKSGLTFALHNWIRQLLEKQLSPVLTILEETTNENWPDAERHWIEHYRDKNGAKFMLNMTDGGDCGPLMLGEEQPTATVSNETVIRIREDRALGLTYAALSKKYSLPKYTICRICTGRLWSSVGGPIQTPQERSARRFTDEEIENMRNLYATGNYSQEQLASMFNTIQRSVHLICTGKRYAGKSGDISGYNEREWRIGSGNPSARLSDEAVLEIRRAYAAKEMVQAQLAHKYGVSQNTISKIVRREKWTHI